MQLHWDLVRMRRREGWRGGGADFRSADQFSPDFEYFMEGLVQQAHGRAQKHLIRRGHKHARRAKQHETEREREKNN